MILDEGKCSRNESKKMASWAQNKSPVLWVASIQEWKRERHVDLNGGCSYKPCPASILAQWPRSNHHFLQWRSQWAREEIYPEKITHLISSSQTSVPQFSWIPWYPPAISHLSKPWKISHFKMMLRCWDHDLDSWIPLVFLLTCTYHHSKWHRKKPTASISGHPTASVLRQDWFVVLQRVGFRRKSIEIAPKYEE